jgi:beta-glucanase (GH16 family)
VSTQGRASLVDGDYVEARVRVPKGDGLWPAFWACTSDSWPPEIDGFEFFDSGTQSLPQFNYHDPEGNVSGPSDFGDPNKDYRDDWHTYGWLRNRGSLIPYLDGVAYPEAGASEVDTREYFLILNLSIYRDSSPRLSGQQGELLVDWVRVWRPAD